MRDHEQGRDQATNRARTGDSRMTFDCCGTRMDDAMAGYPEEAKTHTDNQGRYRFDDLKPGSYRLVVHQAGIAIHMQRFLTTPPGRRSVSS